jgi:hypothetical protein
MPLHQKKRILELTYSDFTRLDLYTQAVNKYLQHMQYFISRDVPENVV